MFAPSSIYDFFDQLVKTMMYGCEVILFRLHVCTVQHLRWGPSTETVGISSVFTRDASGCESQLRSLIIGKRSTPDQKLELMMTELDDTKMRIFDQKFSKDGLDCRQVISLQHFQSVSEVGDWQAAAWDEDGRLPLLSHWLLHERDHGGRGWKLYKSSELGGTQEP